MAVAGGHLVALGERECGLPDDRAAVTADGAADRGDDLLRRGLPLVVGARECRDLHRLGGFPQTHVLPAGNVEQPSRRSAVRPVYAAEERLSGVDGVRSEEHTSELQSLMRISYAVLC